MRATKRCSRRRLSLLSTLVLVLSVLSGVHTRTFLDVANHLLVTTIPKSGCTTVEGLFLAFVHGAERAALLSVHADIALLEPHSALAKQALAQGVQPIVFVRHPVARAASFFGDKIGRWQQQMFLRCFRAFEGELRPGGVGGFANNTISAISDDKMETVAEEALRVAAFVRRLEQALLVDNCVDDHFMRQVNVASVSNIPYQRVFHLETWDTNGATDFFRRQWRQQPEKSDNGNRPHADNHVTSSATAALFEPHRPALCLLFAEDLLMFGYACHRNTPVLDYLTPTVCPLLSAHHHSIVGESGARCPITRQRQLAESMGRVLRAFVAASEVARRIHFVGHQLAHAAFLGVACLLVGTGQHTPTATTAHQHAAGAAPSFSPHLNHALSVRNSTLLYSPALALPDVATLARDDIVVLESTQLPVSRDICTSGDAGRFRVLALHAGDASACHHDIGGLPLRETNTQLMPCANATVIFANKNPTLDCNNIICEIIPNLANILKALDI